MQDSIDKRNFREKCARSIVKGYNVRYVMPQEITEAQEPKEETEDVMPQSEGAYEADVRYAAIPSSQYGTKRVEDPVTKEQIDKILGEQKNNLFEEMKESQ